MNAPSPEENEGERPSVGSLFGARRAAPREVTRPPRRSLPDRPRPRMTRVRSRNATSRRPIPQRTYRWTYAKRCWNSTRVGWTHGGDGRAGARPRAARAAGFYDGLEVPLFWATSHRQKQSGAGQPKTPIASRRLEHARTPDWDDGRYKRNREQTGCPARRRRVQPAPARRSGCALLARPVEVPVGGPHGHSTPLVISISGI
jgi:hypothetical protein